MKAISFDEISIAVILAGKKTMTRRPAKRAPDIINWDENGERYLVGDGGILPRWQFCWYALSWSCGSSSMRWECDENHIC